MSMVAIYALIYSKNLDLLESILNNFSDNIIFRKIEQNSVLLLENDDLDFSLEPSTNDCYYMSGQYNGLLEDVREKIIDFANQLKNKKIYFSIDYQEENLNHEPLGDEYHISYTNQVE